MAKREIPGVWWLTNNPDEKWIGTLFLEADETPTLSVTVAKGFYQISNWPIPAVLHGHDQSGYPITLLYAGRPSSSGGAAITKMTISAGTAIIGLEVAEAAAFKVNRLMVNMQHLLEWSGMTGFIKGKLPSEDDLQIRYKFPPTKRFQLEPGLTVEFETSFSHTNNGPSQTLEEEILLSFRSETGLGYMQINHLTSAFRQLLHFALFKRIYPLKITAHCDGYGHSLEGKLYPHSIEIFTSLLREPARSEYVEDRWIFRFSDVESDFGTFLAKWLKYTVEFEEPLADYFTTIYHRLPGPVEHLCLTQALDAYHGIKYNSHKKHEYRKKVQQLIEAHASSLKGLIDKPEDFAETVEHNRNWYTHHNPKWKAGGRVVSGSSLLRLNEKLRLVIQMNILSDLGIPEARFLRLRKQLASHMIDYGA